VGCDLLVSEGHIARIAPPGAVPRGGETLDLAGRVVLPAFVDCHTHLDKGHISPRKPNPNGTFEAALQTAGEDRAARWTADDLRRRMDFSLRSAHAHGTVAIRTHLDSIAPQDEISWPVFQEMREEWRGRIILQAACLAGIDLYRDAAWFNALVRRVKEAGGVLGAVTWMLPDLDALLDRMFVSASEHGLDLDFHVDETSDPASVSLRHIAEAAIRHRFAGKILCGHCCSLAQQADGEADRTLDLVARADIAVVSLPLCNLYLQDRRADGTTPRWRGVTLLHEMKARGITVAVASDNTRDPFHAYGDLDMLEVFRAATRVAHLDHPFGDWIAAATATPARIMGLDGFGILRESDPADFVILKGRRWTEVLARPEADRIVVRGGRTIARTLPDYSELDDLMGAA
jgi:cytosine deaminase